MSIIKRNEMDRPTHNSLTYLTRVKPHHITRDAITIDHFMRNMMIEYYGFDPINEFEGTTRSFYSIEGHYANLWNFDRQIIQAPEDPLFIQAIEHTRQAMRLPQPVACISWDALNTVPFIRSSGAGYGYRGKKGDTPNLERAIRLAVAHLNYYVEEQKGLRPKGEFRYTPDLAWTRTSLGTLQDPKIRHV